MRLLRRHPGLLVEQVAQYAEAERAVAELVEMRLPVSVDRPLRARLLAATLLGALRIAVERWIEDPPASLPDVLTGALDLTAPACEG